MGISNYLIDDLNEILGLIPQKPPMVMIDKLVSSDNRNTRTSFTIAEDNIFCENGFFTEPGIIENMAQTASIKNGFDARLKEQKPPIGFIGEIKNLKIYFLPKINETLMTTITIEYEVLNALIIHSQVNCNNNIVAECKMKIFLENK